MIFGTLKSVFSKSCALGTPLKNLSLAKAVPTTIIYNNNIELIIIQKLY